jgi:hypothetical protein
MRCAAKCYWPDVTEADLEQVAERAARAGLGTDRPGLAKGRSVRSDRHEVIDPHQKGAEHDI